VTRARQRPVYERRRDQGRQKSDEDGIAHHADAALVGRQIIIRRSAQRDVTVGRGFKNRPASSCLSPKARGESEANLVDYRGSTFSRREVGRHSSSGRRRTAHGDDPCPPGWPALVIGRREFMPAKPRDRQPRRMPPQRLGSVNGAECGLTEATKALSRRDIPTSNSDSAACAPRFTAVASHRHLHQLARKDEGLRIRRVPLIDHRGAEFELASRDR
jgi:hypothetical protein